MTEMTLDDLKVGDIVKTRDENYLLVLSNIASENGLGLFSLKAMGCYAYLSNYNQDLMSCESRYKDIIAVYKSSESNKKHAYGLTKRIMTERNFISSVPTDLIDSIGWAIEWDWVREETKKMTIEEIEKALGYKIEIVSTKGE